MQVYLLSIASFTFVLFGLMFLLTGKLLEKTRKKGVKRKLSLKE